MTTDPPLEPMESAGAYTAEVIDLAGVRIKHGKTPYKSGESCKHLKLIYSQSERRVWCEDCSRTIDAFDAFLTYTRHLEAMLREVRHKTVTAEEALKSSVRRRATKELDRVWSGNVHAVACPHCNGGLLPEDFARGASWTSKELEIARRKRKAESKKQ